jgi:hypothetical protein
LSVRKFWLSGMSPVAADLASAARAAPPSGDAPAPVAGALAEGELLELVLLELPPQPAASSRATSSRAGEVLLSMRARVPQRT